jgi:PAS domain S-box-containing protein
MHENVENTKGWAETARIGSGGAGIIKRSSTEDSGYELLFEAVADGMLLATADGTILDANPEACALLKRTREEVVTAGHGAIFDASDPRLVAAMQERREAGRFKGELRLLHRDGSSFPAEVSFAAYRGEERDENTVIVFRDVTEREEAERKLRETEARFRTLVEQIPAITYIEAVDSEERSTNLLYASPQIEVVFGYTPEEWMADTELFPRLLHPDDRERVLAEDERTENSGEPFRAEYRQYTKDGRVIWVRDEATLVRDYEGRPMFWQGVMFDITEQKRYEEKLAALVEELRRSNIELEQFAYVASHDLQEPLRMVASYTQLLARRYEGKLDSDADEFIGYAVDGANRMQTLINDLLAYSRVGTRGKELVSTDTQAAFEAARANLRTAIEETGAEVVCSVELPTVVGDGIQLTQLFQNLIANAIKFSSREGEVPRVEVGSKRLGYSSSRDEEWLFWVADNGMGIEPQYKERIFRIFQRLHGKGEYSGTGIGLAICKKIVERHGGRIWVKSEVGEGSTFYFTLRP